MLHRLYCATTASHVTACQPINNENGFEWEFQFGRGRTCRCECSARLTVVFYSRKESASLAKPSWPMLSSVRGTLGRVTVVGGRTFAEFRELMFGLTSEDGQCCVFYNTLVEA